MSDGEPSNVVVGGGCGHGLVGDRVKVVFTLHAVCIIFPLYWRVCPFKDIGALLLPWAIWLNKNIVKYLKLGELL